MLFSEPKIPQCSTRRETSATHPVSVLFSEPKIPQFARATRARARDAVSVLFSEPKIPQSGASTGVSRRALRFSALQRAENSSTQFFEMFYTNIASFSALQRAENSSTCLTQNVKPDHITFQCSSASRKFLNHECPSERA